MSRRIITVIAVSFALIMSFIMATANTASADNGNGKNNGKGNPHASVTEDTDADGVGNNIPDAGDNRHPSGKDRSVEHGNSGDQGNAQADPDDDGRGPDRTNGGQDQPGGPGGVDKEDQDRNNGCGNDDDFEDDNEGWCGHKPKPPVVPPVPPVPPVVPPVEPPVEPPVFVRPPTQLTPPVEIIRNPPVAPVQPPVTLESLPRTGTSGEVSSELLIAMALLLAGVSALIASKKMASRRTQ